VKPEVVMLRRKFSRELKVEVVKLARKRGAAAAAATGPKGFSKIAMRSGISSPDPSSSMARS
jgi:transposase-like protein